MEAIVTLALRCGLGHGSMAAPAQGAPAHHLEEEKRTLVAWKSMGRRLVKLPACKLVGEA